MGEKLFISKMPEPGAVISHGILNSRKMSKSGKVAIVSLMKCLHTQQVSSRSSGGGAAFALPGQGRGIVSKIVDG
jgi:hypothetical protein